MDPFCTLPAVNPTAPCTLTHLHTDGRSRCDLPIQRSAYTHAAGILYPCASLGLPLVCADPPQDPQALMRGALELSCLARGLDVATPKLASVSTELLNTSHMVSLSRPIQAQHQGPARAARIPTSKCYDVFAPWLLCAVTRGRSHAPPRAEALPHHRQPDMGGGLRQQS